MRDSLECYKILGLEPGASAERVRNAYLQLSHFYDPSRYVDDGEQRSNAEKKKLDIEEAYKELSRFLPVLADPSYGAEAPKQDRDFSEMSRAPTSETSKMLFGILIAIPLLALFVWAYHLYKQTRAIPVAPVAVVVEDSTVVVSDSQTISVPAPAPDSPPATAP